MLAGTNTQIEKKGTIFPLETKQVRLTMFPFGADVSFHLSLTRRSTGIELIREMSGAVVLLDIIAFFDRH